MAIQTTLNDLLASAESFGALYDMVNEQFNVPVWQRYGSDAFSSSLDWKDIQMKIEKVSAASMIDYSAEKPIFTNPTASTINGELATFGNKYQFSKREMRTIRDLETNMGKLGIDGTKLIKFLYPHLENLAIGPHKTLDILLLEALSKGTMTMDATNNPHGLTMAVDWKIAQATVGTVWSDAAASPITDIRKVIEDNEDREFIKIMMSRPTFNKMVATTEFKNQFGFEISTAKGVMTTPKFPIIGLDMVNAFFSAGDLPMIEIVNDKVGVQGKDGSITTIRPFADNRVTFVTSDDLVTVQYTYAEEQVTPDAEKVYTTSNNVMISAWNKAGGRFFESEFNAFPILNYAKEMVILKTDATA